MNNDPNDPNLDEDFDANNEGFDNDFGEFDTRPEKGSVSSALSGNPVIKIGLAVAAVLVIVGGIALFGGSDEDAAPSVVAGGNEIRETTGKTELSPEMKQVYDEYEQQRLEEAVNTGSSVIPQPTDAPKERLPVPNDETGNEDPLARWRQIQEERLLTEQTQQQGVAVQPQTPEQQQVIANQQAEVAALQAAMTNQMSQIISGKRIDSLRHMQITDLQALMAQQNGLNGAAQAGGLTQQQADLSGLPNGLQAPGIDPLTGLPLEPPKVILPAGAIEYAQLLNEANSDVPGPVVSMIVSGPFAGSRILGTFQRQNEYLVIEFSTLVDKKGNSIPVQAYALDPDTTLTGMATDVDHRYWERVILPAAAEFVQGMGEAYSNQQGTDIAVTGDVVVQSQPPLNTKEQIAAGVEEAADRVADILEEEGQGTQILVRVKAGAPMGILFMTPITDQDQLIARNSPTTATSINQQRQQQQQLLFQQQLLQGQQQQPLYLQGAANAASGFANGVTGQPNLFGTPTTNGTGYSNRTNGITTIQSGNGGTTVLTGDRNSTNN